jgi:hypothetical protein
MITTIETTKDGSKLMSYNGIEFWVSRDNVIVQSYNWDVAFQLVDAGLATRTTYKHLMSHTEYKLK